LLPECGDLPGMDAAPKDTDYQVPTPARKLQPPRMIVRNAGAFGNCRAISVALQRGGKCINTPSGRQHPAVGRRGPRSCPGSHANAPFTNVH
jgi:hypothetical protein